MDRQIRQDKPARIFSRLFFLAFLFAILMSAHGCTRPFFRKLADKEAHAIIAEKDVYPGWKLQNFFVVPDQRSRFAPRYNPDRPPMPPDDPAAAALAPMPQWPYPNSGVAWVEGDGYVKLLRSWSAANRLRQQMEKKAKEKEKASDSNVKTASYQEKASDPVKQSKDKNGQQKKGEVLPPPEKIEGKIKGEKLPAPEKVSEPEKLPKDLGAEPFLITLEQALEMAMINSREFQNWREDVYLTALPVTLQRFSFAAQSFFTEQTIRQVIGRELAAGPANQWNFNSSTGFTKLFSTGALLVLQFANQTVVNLTGKAPHTISVSNINLDIVQPFLRGGGKAVTLEPLTQAERNLVYEIRSYARFRRQFYAFIAGGSTIPSPPGQFSLGGGVGIASFGGLTRPTVAPGSAGRLVLGLGPAAPAQGYLPTLLQAAFLENQKKNVTALEYNLGYMEAAEEGGLVQKLQVNQVELQLLGSRVTVLTNTQNLITAFDQFKEQLGLPVNMKLELDDGPIRPITEHLERYDQTFDYVADVTDKAKKAIGNSRNSPKQLRKKLQSLFLTHPLTEGTKLRAEIMRRWDTWRNSNKALITKTIKEYGGRLDLVELERERTLMLKAQLENKKQSLPPEEMARLEKLEEEKDKLLQVFTVVNFENALRQFESAPWEKAKNLSENVRVFDRAAFYVLDNFIKLMSEARKERLVELYKSWPALPPIVINGENLLETDLDTAQDAVIRTALANRLDLMNAQAQVVDAWRQIRIFANALLGVFNVQYHMDASTPAGKEQPLNFDARRMQNQLIINTELPLVRKSERNNYRASLIGYERARRAMMATQDSIVQTVRFEIRQLRLLAQSYKIQQRTVDLAYPRRENSREALFGPTDPSRTTAAGSSASLTNQLLQAQNSLVGAQNGVYQIWINYLIARQQLYRDMGRMNIDIRGVWTDDLTGSQRTSNPERRGNPGEGRDNAVTILPPAAPPQAFLGQPQ